MEAKLLPLTEETDDILGRKAMDTVVFFDIFEFGRLWSAEIYQKGLNLLRGKLAIISCVAGNCSYLNR